MELTGKAKADFEKWYKEQEYDRLQWSFIEMPYPMQWGVLVDFFDSEDFSIGVYKMANEWCYSITGSGAPLDIGIGFTSLSEARNLVIKKACELYNEPTKEF